MSEILDSYQAQLQQNLRLTSTKLTSPFESKQDWKQLRAMLTECEKCVKLIEAELAGQSGPRRAGKVAKMREYKRKIEGMKKETFQKENNWELEANKRELMGGRTVSNEMIKLSDRTTEATQKLRDSVKLMHENLQISQNVGAQLSNQTTKLINSKKKVVEIRHDLHKGERKIKSMMLRVRKNKFVLRGVLLFIFVVFVVVVVSFFK